MTALTRTARHQRTRAVFASWIGTTIEYYDFSCYGLGASLIFAKIFFPSANPTTGTLLSLSSFGVAYVARPLGALVFGHFGDRMGRRRTLIFTLLLMGVSTIAIGALPTYSQIGLAAPVLLVVARLLQGFAVGGEYGGAILMTVEHSADNKRGLFGSLVNTGTTAGLVLANLAFLLALRLPDEQLLSWGWRIPFLLSTLLVVIGLIARTVLEETPDFAEVKQRDAVREFPIVDVARNHLGTVSLVALGIIASGSTFTLTTVFSLTYGKLGLGLGGSAMLDVLLPATVVVLVALPLFGRLADRVGVRALFLGGLVSLIVLPFVWFALLDTRQYGLMLLGFALLFVGYAANYAVVPAYFAQVFPSGVRFTGLSVGFTIGLIASNAIAPAVATSLLEASGGWEAIAAYMASTAVISLVAGIFLRIPTTGSERVAAPRLVDDSVTDN
ncbi:MFS transporter [Actinomadura montaniterrae]|uniref:Putative proline/betaine transporter n=1 Tax=Actinomadura montaniterrae TaxID=1803903 RepID=A0A6L3W9T4_9ACTN|nr:MFS transporter [Actinomadura montaniterrae]KAB2388759.1 MHS family MFS transporter [Actinomadura montaniterrae]